MMRKYIVAYGAWLIGVFALAACALAWYRYVEGMGVHDLARQLHDDVTDDTEATDSQPGNPPAA